MAGKLSNGIARSVIVPLLQNLMYPCDPLHKILLFAIFYSFLREKISADSLLGNVGGRMGTNGDHGRPQDPYEGHWGESAPI